MSSSLASNSAVNYGLAIAVLLLGILNGCSSPPGTKTADYRQNYDVFWDLVQRREQARIKQSRSAGEIPPDIGDVVERKKKELVVLERGVHPKDTVQWQAKFQCVEREKIKATGKERFLLKFDLPVEHLGKMPAGSVSDTKGACRYRVWFECDEQDLPVWEKTISGTTVSFTGELDDPAITSFTRGNQWFKKGQTSLQLNGLPTEYGVQFEMNITLLHTRIGTADSAPTAESKPQAAP